MFISEGKSLRFPYQALAETNPQLNNGHFYSHNTMRLNQEMALYSKIYKENIWVATVVDKIAASVARLDLQVWDISDPAKKEVSASSEYAAMLSNPSAGLCTYDFWTWVVTTYEIYGECFLLKVRDKSTGKPKFLVPMHPSRTEVERSVSGTIIYKFTMGVSNPAIFTAPYEDVIPFRTYNPDTHMRGVSRLSALRGTLLTEDAARKATESFWQRGARPSVVLTAPGKMSDESVRRLRDRWEMAHAGASRMGGTAVLEDGMTLTPISLNMEEMQYIETRKLSREEVCARYDVPPPVVHILDQATYNNITEQMRSMYRDTMAPRLEAIESTLDYYLRPDFDEAGVLEAKFAIEDILRGDFEARADTLQNLATSGILKMDEVRVELGWPALGGLADKLYANAALEPLGTISNGAIAPGMPTPKPTDTGASSAPKKASQETKTVPSCSSDDYAIRDAKNIDWRKVNERSLMGAFGSDIKSMNRQGVRTQAEGQYKDVLHGVFSEARRVALEWRETGNNVESFYIPSMFVVDLAKSLNTVNVATSKAYGTLVAKSLGGERYEAKDLIPFYEKASRSSAENILNWVQEQLRSTLATKAVEEEVVNDFFDMMEDSETDRLSISAVTSVIALAALNSASIHGAKKKTWKTGRGKSHRSEHTTLEGYSIRVEENFPNGMKSPGDPRGGARNNARCHCYLEFNKDG